MSKQPDHWVIDLVKYRDDGGRHTAESAHTDNPIFIAELVKGREAQVEAEEVYIPAKVCRSATVKTHKALLCLLARRPEVRRRHNGRRRLEVHVKDWLDYLRDAGDRMDPADLPADLAERLLDMAREEERRRAEIDARKCR